MVNAVVLHKKKKFQAQVSHSLIISDVLPVTAPLKQKPYICELEELKLTLHLSFKKESKAQAEALLLF